MSLLVALSALLVACGGRSTPTPEPQTLTFVIYDLPRQLQGSYQRLAEEFHTLYPHLTVDVAYVSSGPQWRSMMQTEADATLAWSYSVPDLDLFRPLDPFLEASAPDLLADYLPRSVDAVRRQGQVMALPADIDFLALYYNRDLFDQAGLSEPPLDWTWSDFVAYGQALTGPRADGGMQYGFYPSDALPGYLPFVAQELSALWGDDLLNPETLRLDGEPVIRAVQWYIDLSQTYGIMPTLDELRRQSGDPILLGRAGMWLGWASERGGRLDVVEWPFRWGVAPLPRGSSDHTVAVMSLYAIPKAASNPEAAWQWLQFLADRTEQVNGWPARRSLAESDGFREQIGADVYTGFRRAAETSIVVSPGPEFERYAVALDQAVRAAAEGLKPVDQALREAQQRVEAASP